ncbi:MAG: WecB/TagA/CpsF family glycosyltransferase [Planctomycetota bacterium]
MVTPVNEALPHASAERAASVSKPSPGAAVPEVESERRTLWSIPIDAVRMENALERIECWIDDQRRDCKMVVTPNVDHVVQLHLNPGLFDIYRRASLTLADGWPIVTLSRLFGDRLPERVAGSDLVPKLCERADAASRPLKLFLLGGDQGVPEAAAATLESRFPAVQVVGTCSPPFGFQTETEWNDRICEQINESEADALVVGLGFPKQELWLLEHRWRLHVSTAMAVGATIDFLAGRQNRAPSWMRRFKLEWLHRLLSDPRRLASRYASDAIQFPLLCLMYSIKRLSARSS